MKASFLYRTFWGRALIVIVFCVITFLLSKATTGLFFPAIFSIALYGGIVWIFLGDIPFENEEKN